MTYLEFRTLLLTNEFYPIMKSEMIVNTLIASLSRVKQPQVAQLGGKGYSLALLLANRFEVPKGFAILSSAFFKYIAENNLTDKIEKLANEIDNESWMSTNQQIKNLVMECPISDELTSAVKGNLIDLHVTHVAVRSSALTEDNAQASFAGQHDTFLNVPAQLGSVLASVQKCWASLFNHRAVIYRVNRRLPLLDGMAVVVQEMIQAEVSGITFTRHPMGGDSLLIEVSYGLGDLIVGGHVEPDGYTVNRNTLKIEDNRIGNKSKMSIVDGDQIRISSVTEGLENQQAIPDWRVKEIAQLCLRVEALFGVPQDIEWCISSNKVWLLQARPITEVVAK